MLRPGLPGLGPGLLRSHLAGLCGLRPGLVNRPSLPRSHLAGLRGLRPGLVSRPGLMRASVRPPRLTLNWLRTRARSLRRAPGPVPLNHPSGPIADRRRPGRVPKSRSGAQRLISPAARGGSPEYRENNQHDHAKRESTYGHTRTEPDHVRIGVFGQSLDSQANDKQYQPEHQDHGTRHRQGDN